MSELDFNVDINMPERQDIGNLKIDKKSKVIKAEFYHLPFYKKDFFEASEYVKFIKAVEKLIRRSKEYKHYISYLKEDIGLRSDALQPNITDDLTDIEMHHGPILTLFDYCDIVTNYYLKKGIGVTTFKIAQDVLELHFENIVQVVMLSKTNHQAVHAGKVFVHPDQAWGDINKFVERYIDGFTDEQIETFNEYVELTKNTRATDGDFLKVSKKFKSYSRNNYNTDDLLDFLNDVNRSE